MRKKPRKNRVLQDHRKRGKKFIPPILQIPNTKGVKFTYQAIPEFLWLAILNNCHGWQSGVALAVSLAQKASAAMGKNIEGFQNKEGETIPGLFAATSSYNDLTDEQKSEVIKLLKLSLEWELLIEALSPLVSWYPECPLKFLFEKAILLSDQNDLDLIKRIVKPLFIKTSKEAVSMYANAMAITTATNKLKIAKGSGLENFFEVEKYPETEESRGIAASIRASVLPMLGMSKIPQDWANYFWNRGLKISPCEQVNNEHKPTH